MVLARTGSPLKNGLLVAQEGMVCWESQMVCQWQQWSVGGTRGYGLLRVTNGLPLATMVCWRHKRVWSARSHKWSASGNNGLLGAQEGMVCWDQQMVCQWQQWSVAGTRGYGLLRVTNGL